MNERQETEQEQFIRGGQRLSVCPECGQDVDDHDPDCPLNEEGESVASH